MVVFVEKPTSRWMSKLLKGYVPGMVIGLGLIVFLRRFDLDPATRLFLGSLPMWFLFTLVSSVGGPSHPWPTRITRSAVFALAVSLMMFAIAQTNGGRH